MDAKRTRNLLLVHHFERGRFDFWVPPGAAGKGLSPFLIARRETFEETNLTVELEKIAYIQEFVEIDYHFCKFFIVCRGFTGAISLQNRVVQEDFLIEARFFSREEIATIDAKPEIMQDQFWYDMAQGFPTTRYLGLTFIE